MKGELATGHITAAELEVWRMLALGYSSKEMADEKQVGIKTIDKHRCELYRKLKARNLADLAVMAVRYGVIEVQVTLLMPVPGPKYSTSYCIPNSKS